MGLVLFSLVLSIIVAGSFWLVVGDLLPPGEDEKWESRGNILAYTVVCFVVTLVTVFLLDF